MIYIATAMMIEARPIIKYYNLKKESAINKVEVFKNQDITLIVVGVGGIKSAVSLTYVLSKYEIDRDDIFASIGVCGAKNREFEIGDVVLCNKIVSEEPKISYYPDMIFTHPFKEGSLESFNSPKYDEGGVVCDVVDMEGAGLSQGVSYFFKPHQVNFVKIVSDYLENSVTLQKITELIDENIAKIDRWIRKRAEFKEDKEVEYTDVEKQKIAEFLAKMRLTKSMEVSFLGYMRYYKLVGKNIVEILDEHICKEIVDKRDVKKILEKIERLK